MSDNFIKSSSEGYFPNISIKPKKVKITKEVEKIKPTEIDENGNKYWKNSDGQPHREDGPAIKYFDGSKEWFVKGKHHRLDGPAIEYANGHKSWYLNGIRYSEDEFKIKVAEMNKDEDKPTRIDSSGNKYWENNKGEYHRVDGPAIECADGSKHWYLNDKLHRVDGPAREYANGRKEWFFNGKPHRKDGPAIVYADLYKAWFIDGKYHREDGPAKEYTNGDKEWYLNGIRYSEDEFKLQVAEMNKDESKPTEIDQYGNKHWKNDKGQFHRVDGPAIEKANGSKYWYLNGQHHRVDGPAIERSNGQKDWWVKEWYLDGIRYSEDEFKLKVTGTNKDEDKPTTDNFGNKFWKNKEGELHREEGPAFEGTNGTKQWYLNGNLHRLGGPAVEESEGHKAWYVNGQLHREDGPAVEYCNGTKEWWVNDKLHRLDGPAKDCANGYKEWWLEGEKYSEEEFKTRADTIKYLEEKIELDEDKPTTIDERGNKFWKNAEGQLHRIDGPAIEYVDGGKSWWINDKLHREDGPAYETSGGYKSWWVNGKLHRLDGPAHENSNGSKEWWIDGIKYSEEDFKLKLCEMNKVKVMSEYWLNENGQYHREDGPAITWDNGVKSWWINGQHHREDGPAIEWPDGTKYWALDGKFMSEDEHKEIMHKKSMEPKSFYKTIETTKEDPYADFDGEKFTKTVLHREDGPARITSLGDKFWYFEGKPHRDNGPAAEFSTGCLQYYKHGKLHRDDGPAIILGDKYCYYINGKLHSLEYKADGNDYYLYGQVLTEREFSWFKKLSNIRSITSEEFYQIYNIMHPLKTLDDLELKKLINIINEMI